MTCDNKRAAHDAQVIAEDDNAMRWYCKECKAHGVIRKDWRGVVENRQYSKVFKRDILQGRDNLFYKYHPEYLHT